MISVGSCSWTEKSLIKSGEFYPGGIKSAEDRLRYYSGHFDTVEVDSTYYAIPAKNNVLLWAQRTPDNFIFHIKVYAPLTGHGVDPRTLSPDIRNELADKDKKAKNVFIRGKCYAERGENEGHA